MKTITCKSRREQRGFNLGFIALLLLLSGCAARYGHVPTNLGQPPQVITQTTEKTFVGVPSLVALEGSRIELGNGWALTAAHNEPMLRLQSKPYYLHPGCDIALVKTNVFFNPVLKFKSLYYRQPVYASGYPIYGTLTYTRGIFYSRTMAANYKYGQHCYMGFTQAGFFGGMSGGGFWDNHQLLVGIGVASSSSYVNTGNYVENIHGGSFFTPIDTVYHWIRQHEGAPLWGTNTMVNENQFVNPMLSPYPHKAYGVPDYYYIYGKGSTL